MAAPAASQGHAQRTHVVNYADTLSEIALRYGVSQEAIMRANNIWNPNHVYVGQVLVIPGSGQQGSPQQATTYVVKRGDTLAEVAIRFNTTLQALMQANSIKNPNHIEVGDVLRIPAQGGKEPVGPGTPPVQQPSRPEPKGPEPQYPEPQRPEPYRPEPKGPEPKGPEPQGPGYRPEPRPERPEYKPERPEHKPSAGWTGSYYSGKYFDKLVETREDAEIRFNWYTDSPGAGIPEDRFSVRWERHAHFQPGWYRFTVVADDGVRVFVDDTLIIDAWKIQPANEYTADVYLTGGVHKLNVDYFEETDHAQIQVSYEKLHEQPPIKR